jgi:electron transport complex protein RnfD
MVHLFGGGLFLGAFFMITDMVTSPLTSKGQVAFGILAGCMVALIRVYGGYPEGVCYSILIANAARPLIDRLTMPRVFGLRQPTVGAAKAAQKAAP